MTPATTAVRIWAENFMPTDKWSGSAFDLLVLVGNNDASWKHVSLMPLQRFTNQLKKDVLFVGNWLTMTRKRSYITFHICKP